MWVETSVLPAKGPTSAASLPIRPANCTSDAARLSLSHSRPRTSMGAGEFTAPVGVWPSRKIVHLPSGTSHVMRPSLAKRAVRSTSRRREIVCSAGTAAHDAREASETPVGADSALLLMFSMRAFPAGVG